MRGVVGSSRVEPFHRNDAVRGFEDTPGSTGHNAHGAESVIIDGECPSKGFRGSPVSECLLDGIELASQGAVLHVEAGVIRTVRRNDTDS